MKLSHSAIAILAATATALSAHAAPGDVFYCGDAGDAEIYVELDSADTVLARLIVAIAGENAIDAGGPSVTELKKTSGTIYEGEGSKFVVIGDQAEYSDASGVYACSPSDHSPLNTSASASPSIVSWGGKLRSKPSTEAKQTGSLQMGESVTVVDKTGVMYQDFPWFEVTTSNGTTGFTWGGILCDKTGQTEGMFNENGCQ